MFFSLSRSAGSLKRPFSPGGQNVPIVGSGARVAPEDIGKASDSRLRVSLRVRSGSLTPEVRRRLAPFPSGTGRALAYAVAVGPGFRAGEIASLTVASADLSAQPAALTVRAAYTKNGDHARQEIRDDLAAALAKWVKGKPADAPLFPGTWHTRAAEMIAADLAAATAALQEADPKHPGIPYRDAAGDVADFHALRNTGISLLVAAGLPPKVIQAWARHSTITLTMDRYARLQPADRRAALAALPPALGCAPVAPDPGGLGRRKVVCDGKPSRGDREAVARTETGRVTENPTGEGFAKLDSAGGDCGPSGIRTQDQGIMSPLL